MRASEQALGCAGSAEKIPKVEALKGVTRSTKGEIWGFWGPTAAGNPPTKCVAGLQPDGGRLRFSVCRLREAKEIALVPEVDTLYRWMTVRQVLDFTAALSGLAGGNGKNC